MKKWLFTIAIILLLSFSVGIYLRSTYTKKDYSEKSNLLDCYVRIIKEEDMILEESIIKDDYQNIQNYDSYVGKIVSETISTEDFSDDPEEEILLEISWVEKWKYELETAEAVALVKFTGKMENIGGALQQEVEILSVYQGELFEEKDVVFLVNDGRSFIINDEGRELMGGIKTNLMEEGKQYLVFFNSTPGKFEHLFYGASLESGIFYFSIEDYKKGYYETEETFVPYSSLKDVEFFCNDEKIYTQILEVKHDMIKKYVK